MRKFTVNVFAYQPVSVDVVVEADSVEDAVAAALQAAYAGRLDFKRDADKMLMDATASGREVAA